VQVGKPEMRKKRLPCYVYVCVCERERESKHHVQVEYVSSAIIIYVNMYRHTLHPAYLIGSVHCMFYDPYYNFARNTCFVFHTFVNDSTPFCCTAYAYIHIHIYV